MALQTPDIIDTNYSGVVAVFAGFYLGTVAWQGNASELFTQLKKEKGYVEFLLACAILSFIVKNDKSGISTPIIGLGILATTLQLSNKIDITGPMKRFSNGEIGLLEAFKQVVQLGI